MKDENKTNHNIELEETEKDHDINEHDIKLFKNFSLGFIAVIFISTIASMIIYFISLDIINGIISLISGACYIAIFASITRLLSNTAYTAKRNRETLIKLTKALEEKDEESIKDIRQNIESEEVGEIIEPIKDICPICFCELPKGIKICPNCGYDTDNPQENLRYMSNTAQENECPCCFAKISPNDIECPNCGYKLKEDKKQEE